MSNSEELVMAIVDFDLDPAQRGVMLERTSTLRAEAMALPGCVRFDVLQDAYDPARVRIHHEWTNQAELKAYLDSAVFEGLGVLLRPQMRSKPESRRLRALPLGVEA